MEEDNKQEEEQVFQEKEWLVLTKNFKNKHEDNEINVSGGGIDILERINVPHSPDFIWVQNRCSSHSISFIYWIVMVFIYFKSKTS